MPGFFATLGALWTSPPGTSRSCCARAIRSWSARPSRSSGSRRCVREVSSELTLDPLWTWSAASGLAPCHPAGRRPVDRPRPGAPDHPHDRRRRHLPAEGPDARTSSSAGRRCGSCGRPPRSSPAPPGRSFSSGRRSRRSPSSRTSPSASSSRCPAPTSSATLLERFVQRPAPPEPRRGVDALPGRRRRHRLGPAGPDALRGRAGARPGDRRGQRPDRRRSRTSSRDLKKGLVEGGGLLEFIPTPEGLDHIGGLEKLKRWIATRKVGLLPEPGRASASIPRRGSCSSASRAAARASPPRPSPRPGDFRCSRSTPGRLLAPFVGESERNLRDALRRVERIAPCVLWIDEIEKAFVSSRSSESDGGVSKRLIGMLLVWMQERASRVFLVATANSVEAAAPRDDAQGPRRRGLLRGPAERRRRAPRSSGSTSPAAARIPRASTSPGSPRASAGFSGAEIEQAVVVGALRGAGGPLPAGHRRHPRRAALDPPALRHSAPSRSTRCARWAAGRCVPAEDAADRPA